MPAGGRGGDPIVWLASPRPTVETGVATEPGSRLFQAARPQRYNRGGKVVGLKHCSERVPQGRCAERLRQHRNALEARRQALLVVASRKHERHGLAPQSGSYGIDGLALQVGVEDGRVHVMLLDGAKCIVNCGERTTDDIAQALDV